MKWFLQFLSLGSAVLYMLLVIIDHRIRDGTAENIVASEAQPNQRRLSVWGPYLPNRSLGQDFASMVVERCLLKPGSRIVCIREIQKTLAQSAKALIESTIQALGVG